MVEKVLFEGPVIPLPKLIELLDSEIVKKMEAQKISKELFFKKCQDIVIDHINSCFCKTDKRMESFANGIYIDWIIEEPQQMKAGIKARGFEEWLFIISHEAKEGKIYFESCFINDTEEYNM